MKHIFIEVDQHICPRGKTVHIFFVQSLPGPNNYLVVLKQDGKHIAQTEAISREAAYDAADVQADLPGDHGDSGWRAVLARLMGKVETAGEWKGSNAEYASRFPVGTRAWLDALMKHRMYALLNSVEPL